MKAFDFSKPATVASLQKNFESKFGQTLKVEGMTIEQLEDVANHVRTKIHTLTDNLHFGHELKNEDYQKSQAMLDIINLAIAENQIGMNVQGPNAQQKKQIIKKIQRTPTLNKDEQDKIIGDLMTDGKEVKEGVEQQSELILAAKDMMDKVTGYLEDLASMKTEGMLELADRIRDEMGADKAEAFTAKIQPAIDSAEQTLSQTRKELEAGVAILTGEEAPADTMGLDEPVDAENDLDDLDTVDDEFGSADAEAGGTEPEGREQRESREVFETSNRVYSKLAGK